MFGSARDPTALKCARATESSVVIVLSNPSRTDADMPFAEGDLMIDADAMTTLRCDTAPAAACMTLYRCHACSL